MNRSHQPLVALNWLIYSEGFGNFSGLQLHYCMQTQSFARVSLTKWALAYLRVSFLLGPVKHFVVALQENMEFRVASPPATDVCLADVERTPCCSVVCFSVCIHDRLFASRLNHSVIFLKHFKKPVKPDTFDTNNQ